ncbi:MAG: hypothetical protein ABIG37_01360 [Nanoarchaeota archaeon]|nr:hypothetical protein [Nanoarchaeota archaeon]
MEEIFDVKPRDIVSKVIIAPFDKAKAKLEADGFSLVSLSPNAQLRIQEGKDAYVSKNGNWTREGIVYIPNDNPKLVRISPILESAKKATKAHRHGKEFYPTKTQIEKAVDSESFELPRKNFTIPTNRFGEESLTVFAFEGEDNARKYGEFLKKVGINKMPIWLVGSNYVNKQEKPFVRQLWFNNFGGRSELLGGNDRDLYYSSRVRGMLETSEKLAHEKLVYIQNKFNTSIRSFWINWN